MTREELRDLAEALHTLSRSLERLCYKVCDALEEQP